MWGFFNYRKRGREKGAWLFLGFKKEGVREGGKRKREKHIAIHNLSLREGERV